MNSDIRVSVNFIQHPKTRKTIRKYGPAAVLSIIALWGFAAQRHPEGDLSDMDVEDIAIAACWEGDAQDFFDMCVSMKWIDVHENNEIHLHGWKEAQGYVINAPARAERSRRAAQARWEKTAKKEIEQNQAHDACSTAGSMLDVCSEHTNGIPGAMLNAENGNAPSPAPSPSPAPKALKDKNTPPKDRSKIQDRARANNGCHVGGGEGENFSSSLELDVSPDMAGNGNVHMPEKRTESVFSGTKRQNANNDKRQEEKAPENAVSCETPFYLPEDMDLGFHQFIDAYPANHREPVGEAAAVWRQLSKARKLPGLPKLLDGIASWQATEQWGKENGRFIPKAANFLRNGLWLSSPPPASAASPFPTREQLDAEAAQLIDISGRKKEPLCLWRIYR